jgi:hypothetical protein
MPLRCPRVQRRLQPPVPQTREIASSAHLPSTPEGLTLEMFPNFTVSDHESTVEAEIRNSSRLGSGVP